MTGAAVVGNYDVEGLAEEVLAKAGRLAAGAPVTVDHLSVFAEFHLGGRPATERVADALRVTAGDRVLDLGCGIGGPARLVAARTGAHVTGIDLTPQHVEAARLLSGQVGLGALTEFLLGDASSLPLAADSVDAAMMLFVGMHVADKTALFTEVRRVLVPGGRLAVYDPVRTGVEQPRFPVPWALRESDSELETPEGYRAALAAAGFEVLAEESLLELVQQHLAEQARLRGQGGHSEEDRQPDLHFGDEAPVRFANLDAALRTGVVEPRLVVSRAR